MITARTAGGFFTFSLFLLTYILWSHILPDSLASDLAEVREIKQLPYKGYTRIVIDLSDRVEFTQKRISNPDRLYFDLKNSRISKEINTSLPVGDGILKTVRAGQFNQDTVRVVLDLEEIRDFKTFFLDDNVKLVIDVYGHKKPVKDKLSPSVMKVVLDPGHGGHDPGAVGPKGLQEKDVVLDIALKLKKILSGKRNVAVFLTREKDIFIPLDERTAFANGKEADLFVSIHANANNDKKARGIETYMLNWTDEEESIKVAARENKVSIKKMKEHMNRYKSEVGMILADLERDNKRDESVKLANYVQKSMVSMLDVNFSNIQDRGVKNALFYVLLGARMPSVLAEISFISNPVEEKLLKKDKYRDNLAKAIADGIDTYLTSAPLHDQKVASRK